MKRQIFILFFYISFSSFSQVAPHKNFTDKLSFMEKHTAESLQKTPFIFNGDNYDLKYHRLQWNINPDTLYISGEVTSYFKTTKPSVSQISFDLSSVLIVDSVKYHSSNLTYLLTVNDALIINLLSALPQNQLDSVSVYYHGIPPYGNGFGSFIKDSHNGTPVIWTLSQPFSAKDWWPCKNDLSDKIDSIDVIVTTPQQYRTASNGMLLSETVQGAFKTTHWKHKYPIASYLIAIAVTNYQSFSAYAHNGADSIQILNYVYPEDLASAQDNVLNVIPSMELFDSLFITYPFINERYGQTQFNWGGGMEHQTMTFLHDFNFELMTHELAHQWVGDKITCCSWHDIWLNEGFATYWTGLAYQYLFNGHYWPIWKKNQINNITSQPGGSVYCADTTNVSRIFYGRLSYTKGAMVLHMLRWTIGDSAFFAGFKNYLSAPGLAYGYACSDDFISYMENASGKDLTGFFNDWLYGEGYPSYYIHCVLSKTNDETQVIINQTQSHPSVSFFEMPVPLKFKDATHDTIIVFDNTYSGQQYTVDPGFRPDSIIFDPDMWIVSAGNTVIYNLSLDLFVFPNPVSDFLNIEYKGYQLQNAELFDIRGMLVRSVNPDPASQGKLKIKMSDLSKGIYILRATFGDKVLIEKIMKI